MFIVFKLNIVTYCQGDFQQYCKQLSYLRAVLVLLNCVPIHVRPDCFSHSITMEVLTPAH